MPHSAIVIPARLNSTRLPRKMLLRETGQSLLQHTYESARSAKRPRSVWIATDHEEIAVEIKRFGGQMVMTSPDCATGTDRVAEAARAIPEADILVNVQGDEPELPGAYVDQVIELLEQNPTAVMATLATPIRSREQLDNPACVKVVCDRVGRARYFSRSCIPYPRQWSDDFLKRTPPVYLQHLGLYAYRRDFLLKIPTLPRASSEELESLEQLRVLDQGYEIYVGVVDQPTSGIDTPEDYRAFVTRTLARRRLAG